MSITISTDRWTLRLYSEEELARILNVEPRTLLTWRAQNKGPDYVRLGKQIFYRQQDVEAWINANVVVVSRA